MGCAATWAAWLTLIGLNLVGAASPGSDVILITRTATGSRRHAIAVIAAGVCDLAG